jgi:hypothetical protein
MARKWMAILATLLLITLVSGTGESSWGSGNPPDLSIQPPAAVATPSGGNSNPQLIAVACASNTTCIAVGPYYESSDGSYYFQSLFTVGTEVGGAWSWSSPTTVTPDSTGYGSLNGIACPSATTCIAVGSDQTGTTLRPEYTVISNQNGTWTAAVATQVALGSQDNPVFQSVACPSPTQCILLGTNDGPMFSTAQLQGGSWQVSSPVAIPTSAPTDLIAVSCPSLTSCMAVGTEQVASSNEEVVESGELTSGVWNWAGPTVISPDANGGGILFGISCPTETDCVADGNAYSSQSGELEADIVTTGRDVGGNWQWTQSEDLDNGGASSPGDIGPISCSTDLHCMLVGAAWSCNCAQYATGVVDGTGSSDWSSLAQVSEPGIPLITFQAVVCLNRDTCVATGYVDVGASGAGASPHSTTLTSGGAYGSVTIATAAPSPPRRVRVTPSDGALLVTWQSPSQVGASAVSGFAATAATTGVTRTCKTVKSSCRLTGLPATDPFEVTASAQNLEGSSSPAAYGSLVYAHVSRSASLLSASRTAIAGEETSFIAFGFAHNAVLTWRPSRPMATCRTNEFGQCAVDLRLWTTGATTVSVAGGGHTATISVYVPRIHVPATAKRSHILSVEIRSGRPGSKGIMRIGGVSRHFTLPSNGSIRLDFVPMRSGTLGASIELDGSSFGPYQIEVA